MTEAQDPVRLEEAAAWRAVLASDSAAPIHPDRFAAWLDEPANAEAFARVEAAAETAAALRSEPPMMRLRAETRARVAAARRGPPRSAIAAGLAAALALAGLAGWRLAHAPSGPGAPPEGRVYATRVAERLTARLPDGSTAILNTASRLRIVFNPRERRLLLEAGQAYFDVAHDAARPFVVAARDRTVTAHGTQFDVRLRPAGLDVVLFRGAVTVARPGAAGGVPLRPNQILSITPSRTSVASLAKGGGVEGWRDGQVSFDDTPLAEAVAEMNRYVDRPAVVGSPQLGAMRVSGAFRTDGMKAFQEALEAGFGVRVVSGRDRDILLEAEAPRPK